MNEINKRGQLIDLAEKLLNQAEKIDSVKSAEVFIQSKSIKSVKAQFNNIEPCNSYFIEGAAIRLYGSNGISNKFSFSLNTTSEAISRLKYKKNEASQLVDKNFPQLQRKKKDEMDFADDRIIQAEEDDYITIIEDMVDIHTASYMSIASANLTGISENRVILNTGSDPICETSTWVEGKFRVDLQATYNLISVQREFISRTWDFPLSEIKSEVVARAMVHSSRTRSLRTRDFRLPLIFSPNTFSDIFSAFLRSNTLLSDNYRTRSFTIKEPLTVSDDPTLNNGKNSFIYDDEGTYTQKTCIIEDGELINPLSRIGVNDSERLTGNGFRVSLENPQQRLYHHNIAIHPSNIVINSPNKLDSIFSVSNAIFVKRLFGIPYINHVTGDFILTAGEGREVRNYELTSYIAPFQIKGNLFSLFENEFELGGDLEQHYSKNESVNVITPAFITNNCQITHQRIN
ncbi:MAG: metallopeptidase TldD-related protein [Candidatus Kariarchaeaceae archaeon]